MNLRKLLTQAAVAIVAIAGEAAISYFFNRKNGA
jgi:hypothetical protein